MSGAEVPSPPMSSDPPPGLARWLTAHPQATLLAIAAFVARRDPDMRSSAAASDILPGCPPNQRCVSELQGASL